jgi:hypothetical protein
MKVDLHIERLVLRGFKAGERHGIGAALQQELSRLFAEQGVPPGLAQGLDAARLDAGAFQAERGVPARDIGARVAQAVYRGMSR